MEKYHRYALTSVLGLFTSLMIVGGLASAHTVNINSQGCGANRVLQIYNLSDLSQPISIQAGTGTVKLQHLYQDARCKKAYEVRVTDNGKVIKKEYVTVDNEKKVSSLTLECRGDGQDIRVVTNNGIAHVREALLYNDSPNICS